MNDVPERDALSPGLLRDSLRDGLSAESPQCLDAETLAAWFDDELSARDRAAAETHAASCARCQALVAAMARVAPAEADAPAAERAWWTRPLAWLVPIAGAAAAVVVWMAVPRTALERRTPPPESAVATAAAPIAPAPAPSSLAAPAAEPAKAKQAASDAPRNGAAFRAPEARQQKPAKESATGSSAVPKSEVVDATKALAGARPEAPPPPAALAAPPPPPPPASAQPAPLAAPPTAARTADAAAAAGSLADRRERNFVANRAAAAPMAVVTPNPRVSWRMLVNGVVERTVDGGETWATQDTGAGVTLTAGSAPTDQICWLAGPRGVVVLSLDGRTWRGVPLPDAAAVATIVATDATHATATTTTGRRFVTADGGLRWTMEPR